MAAEQHSSELYSDSMYEPTGFGDIGLYMRNKRLKTQVQHREFRKRHTTDDIPQIFAGVSIHVNGQTNTPSADFQNMILLHGGIILPVLDRKSQIRSNGYIVASYLPPSKRKDFKDYRVVTEDFVLESCRQRKLLPWSDFKLKHNVGQDTEINGNVPGGVPAAQLDLLGMRKDAGPSTARPITQHAVPKAKGGHVSTDPVDAYSAYLPTKRTHRARQLLMDDNWRKEHTAVAPDFIEGYFKQSRLHHLSFWKAALPSMVSKLCQELIAEGKIQPDHQLLSEPPKLPKLTGQPSDNRTIFHVDFDCFFSSAGLRARPDLKGKPVAVCHAKGGENYDGSTSEIASCSYEARAFGVRNGISLGKARELCPDIQTMPYNFELYSQISADFYKILLSHAERLQPISVDECYIEVSKQVAPISGDVEECHRQAMKIAETIRDDVRRATGCEVSVGISHNMVLARLATKRAKPCSTFHLLPDAVSDFMAPLDVDELPGVGWSQTDKLEKQLNVKNLGQLRQIEKSRLQKSLGDTIGSKVWNYARGIDERHLEPPPPRKSVSVELNYAIRFISDAEVQDFMLRLAAELASRLKELQFAGKALTLKVMKKAANADIDPPKFLGHGPCDTVNASHAFPSFTNDPLVLGNMANKLMKQLAIEPDQLRGIALNMQKLNNAETSVPDGQRKLQFGSTKLDTSKVGTSKSAAFDAKPKATEVIEILSSPPSLPQDSSVILVGAAEEKPNLRGKRKRPSTTVSPDRAAREVKKQSILKAPVTKSFFNGAYSKSQSRITTDGKIEYSADLGQLPDPSKVTDAQLKAYGIDVDFYRDPNIGNALRLDILTAARTQIKAAAQAELQQRAAMKARKLKTGQTSSFVEEEEDLASKVNKPLKAVPLFKKKRDMDSIRALLEKWVQDAETSEDIIKQAAPFEKFLMACLDAQPEAPSPDIERVTSILQWLRFLVTERHSAAWQVYCDELLERVNKKVFQMRGKRIYV